MKRLPLCRPAIGADALPGLAAVLESGHLVQGAMVKRLEELLAGAMGGGIHAAATSSGTAALWLALEALGVGPGDEVIVPAVCFPAPINAVELLGATPVPVDVRAGDWALDPQRVARASTPRTRAVIGVDPFGVSAPWPALEELARVHGFALVEDAACALGAREPTTGRPCGTFGDVACLSFHPRKIVTTAEGGAVLSRDDQLISFVRARANHGLSSGERIPERFSEIGYNLRLSDVHAALGLPQMERLSALLAQRRAVADAYATSLAGLPVTPLAGLAWPESAVQSYVALLDPGLDRERVLAGLAARGVEATLASYAAHRLPYYARRYGWAAQDFPMADAIATRGLTLPCFAGMDPSDAAYVAAALSEAVHE